MERCTASRGAWPRPTCATRPRRRCHPTPPVRLRLVGAGDELVGVMPFMKIPERFNRRFEELRSTNNLIAGVAGIVALLVYGVGGVLLGSLWLARRHWLVWRPALVAGLCVGALLAAALL